MKTIFKPLVVLILGLSLVGCNDDNASPTSPSATAEQFTARLLPSNEVPPIANTENTGSATATITFNVTKDSAGSITGATADFTVTASGFPSGTTLTRAHIHTGAAGTNGGIVVNLGLADGEVVFASGGGSFTKNGVALTIDQANAIIANPAGFYLNIHTARNPDGVARGQLSR